MKFLYNKYIQSISFIFPNSRLEYLLLLVFFLVYYSLGIFITLTTNIIDYFDSVNKIYICDTYFDFDNGACLYTGVVYIARATHPFTNLFYLPLIKLYNLIIFLNLNTKVYTLIVVSLCSFFVSYSNLLIYKYLKNICNLNVKISLLITILYFFFSGNIILSFTPETFTFSLFLLTTFTYISSYYIYKEKKLNIFYYIFSGFIISGQTITNAPKSIIPILFEPNLSIYNKLKKILLSTSAIIILFCIKRNLYSLITDNLTRQKNYEDNSSSTLDTFISFFFGGNILFPSLRNTETSIELNYYNNLIQKIIIFCFIGLLGISLIKNFKNKFFWILFLSFGVDLIYHFIFKVSLNKSFIYGGHFIFIIPLIIGWIFPNLKNNNLQKTLFYILLLFTIMIMLNNSYRMYQFIYIAQKMYSYP